MKVIRARAEKAWADMPSNVFQEIERPGVPQEDDSKNGLLDPPMKMTSSMPVVADSTMKESNDSKSEAAMHPKHEVPPKNYEVH